MDLTFRAWAISVPVSATVWHKALKIKPTRQNTLSETERAQLTDPTLHAQPDNPHRHTQKHSHPHSLTQAQATLTNTHTHTHSRALLLFHVFIHLSHPTPESKTVNTALSLSLVNTALSLSLSSEH